MSRHTHTHTIRFTREKLNEYKELCRTAKLNNSTSFIWKNMLVNIQDAEDLIKKLEASPILSFTYTEYK